jgi:hypothetical protein
MKRLVIVLISALMFSCATSKVFNTPDPVIANFTNSKTSAENYILANEWMVETFNNAESVIQFSDKEQGIVKGKYFLAKTTNYNTLYGPGAQNILSAIITIRVRDNMARIEIEPPLDGFMSSQYLGVEYGYTPAMFEKDTKKLVDSFESRMMKSKTDW